MIKFSAIHTVIPLVSNRDEVTIWPSDQFNTTRQTIL